MSKVKHITLTSLTALAVLSWTHPVIAAESSDSAPAADAVVTASASTTTTSSFADVSSPSALPAAGMRRNPFGSMPMTAAALASKRGGDRVFNDNQLKGIVADNHASNLSTGMNVISDGAFSGSVGLPTVIQNSGNNVLIQNATIVNVQLK